MAAANSYPAEKENVQFRKQTELQQIKPKKPVKMRLERRVQEGYSRELSGGDVDEIVKTDTELNIK